MKPGRSPFPDDPAWLDGEDGELPEPADARLALEYATAALVAGEVDLARHIYVYARLSQLEEIRPADPLALAAVVARGRAAEPILGVAARRLGFTCPAGNAPGSLLAGLLTRRRSPNSSAIQSSQTR